MYDPAIWIDPTDGYPLFVGEWYKNPACLRTTPDVYKMAVAWYDTEPAEDYTISGVFADFLDEHRDDFYALNEALLSRAAIDGLLDKAVGYLRGRFTSRGRC